MPPLVPRLALVALFAASLFFTGPWLRAQLGIELELDVEAVRAFADGLGPMAPVLFVGVVAARALLWLPSQVVLIAAGLCFGTFLGALVGGAGLMISGIFLFALARYAGRAAVERRIGEKGRALLDFAGHRQGAVALALGSGYPLTPLSPLQASAGLTAMPLSTFIPAAFFGGTIRAATYAFFGDAMLDLDGGQIAAALLLLVGVVALPLATASGRRWVRGIFDPRTDGGGAPPER